jgi:hypothetical protein
MEIVTIKQILAYTTTNLAFMTKLQQKLSTYLWILYILAINWSGPGSSVGIATGYGLDGPGIESR